MALPAIVGGACWRGGRGGRWLGSSGGARRQGGTYAPLNTRIGEELAHFSIAARGRDTHVGTVALDRETVQEKVVLVWQTFLSAGHARNKSDEGGSVLYTLRFFVSAFNRAT